MKQYDCFNGDADGICALIQLRLNEPRRAELVTGVKRDIKLLERVQAESGDQVTALDISMDKNKDALNRILQQGAEVFYSDHHFAGDIPEHDKLTAIINTTPDVCTSLLINQHLNSQYLEWAVVGTFGDNLKKSAHGLAKPLNLDESKLEKLENLGIYINYNGYGSNLEDLHFHPAELYRAAQKYSSPFDFMQDGKETYLTLEQGYHDDMAKVNAINTHAEKPHAAVYLLPDAPWARRVSGVFGNDLANRYPDRAHAVITDLGNENYIVSVRAPLNNKQGADEICRQFETGGGRKAAAGINLLPNTDLDKFINTFSDYYS